MWEGALPFSYCSLIDPEKGEQKAGEGGGRQNETEVGEEGGLEQCTEQRGTKIGRRNWERQTEREKREEASLCLKQLSARIYLSV